MLFCRTKLSNRNDKLLFFFSWNYSNAVNDGTEVKPRSLRFTWSMKTTSSRDPNEIMAEIKKVIFPPKKSFKILKNVHTFIFWWWYFWVDNILMGCFWFWEISFRVVNMICRCRNIVLWNPNLPIVKFCPLY